MINKDNIVKAIVNMMIGITVIYAIVVLVTIIHLIIEGTYW